MSFESRHMVNSVPNYFAWRHSPNSQLWGREVGTSGLQCPVETQLTQISEKWSCMNAFDSTLKWTILSHETFENKLQLIHQSIGN